MLILEQSIEIPVQMTMEQWQSSLLSQIDLSMHEITNTWGSLSSAVLAKLAVEKYIDSFNAILDRDGDYAELGCEIYDTGYIDYSEPLNKKPKVTEKNVRLDPPCQKCRRLRVNDLYQNHIEENRYKD